MYQRILVPLDGSGFSEQMIAPAAALAKATGSELMLLRGIDLDGDEAGALHYLETQGAPVGAKGVCVRAGTDTSFIAGNSSPVSRIPWQAPVSMPKIRSRITSGSGPTTACPNTTGTSS